jgi:hypothetical protein
MVIAISTGIAVSITAIPIAVSHFGTFASLPHRQR